MPYMTQTMMLGFIPNIGPFELAALALLGLLIFGKRLPEVGKSIGRGIVEFKRGLAGFDDDLDLNQAPQQQPQIEQHRAEQTNVGGQPTPESEKNTSPDETGQARSST